MLWYGDVLFTHQGAMGISAYKRDTRSPVYNVDNPSVVISVRYAEIQFCSAREGFVSILTESSIRG